MLALLYYQALNYGSIGTVIGHEITHSFDTQGRHFDYVGNLVNWWEKETETEFVARAECFLEEYSHYKIYYSSEEIKSDSSATLQENIADNGGFREALHAFRKLISKNSKTQPQQKLPLFENYTQEQLFTLGFANMWCEKETILSSTLASVSDHSPNRVRVNGVARNSEDFARIWNCPEKSNMNPTKKCQLW